MSKLVVISLLGGNLDQGFPVVTAQFSYNNQFLKIIGSLPGVPELTQLYTKWQLLYEAVHQRMGNNQRIKMYQQDINNVSVNDFETVCKQLQINLNNWLKCESFQNIERQLRTLLSQDDEIKVIIETDIILLHRLPWHLWDFFDHYPLAELALSNHEYASPRVSRTSSLLQVRILAVLGNSYNIDVDEDRSLLKKLKAQTTFLVNPTRIELDEQLWNHDWDILFFAGHSGSDEDVGKIYINETESLTVFQLKNALSNAIERGLKLAIFNSCDGINLARNFADLNIPQIIVMRERVPDLVAQKFLKNFLFAFAGGKSLYLAMREARAKLQGLENTCPCASWLPVIYQNPTTVTSTWQSLCGVGATTSKTSKKVKLWEIIASTLVVATSIISLRYLGTFEKIELQAFDQMLVLRPEEKPDKRVLVVEVTEEYIQSVQQNNRGLKSISDAKLAKLLNKIQKYRPSVIGIDIYRDFADPIDKLEPITLDAELSQNNVIAVCKGKDSKYDPQGVKPPASVPVERVGFTDGIKDLDGIVRRQILVMPQEASSPCQTNTSLALQLAGHYLANQSINFNYNEDYIQFGNKIFKRLKPGRSGAYQQKTDLDGIQILINYSNVQAQSVTIQDVLNNKVTPDLFKDRVVIIGVTANTIRDTWSTPYSATQANYQEIPGVFIQAQMLSQILNAVLEKRPILWVLPYWGDILLIYGWSLASSLIVWRLLGRGRIGALVTTVVILYGVCILCLFQQGLWLPFIPSAFGVVLSEAFVLLIERHQNNKISLLSSTKNQSA